MLDAQRQYIINLANLGNVKSEMVGELALFTRSQLEKGITLPVGFVITTTAFDDFLVANDLVDEIGPLINTLDYTNIDLVKKSSSMIKQAFNKAVFPDIIKQPLQKAYTGLSGFSELAVNIRVSPINDELGLSVKGGSDHFFGVSGFDSLLEHIKEVWSDFFSPNALLYRGKIGYEGFLTEAVIVQKMVHAEVSGRIYTINPTDNDPTVMEIQAFWGLDDGQILNEIVPDSYFIDKRSGDVIEKKVVSQDFMIVRKSKGDPSEPYMKVKISAVWQKRPKLDDRHLYLLFDYASRVAQLKDKPQEISWCLESGRVYFLDNVDFAVDVEASQLYPLKPSTQRELDQYARQAEREMEVKKPDLDEYVAEVQKDVKEQEVEITQATPEVAEEPQKDIPIEPAPLVQTEEVIPPESVAALKTEPEEIKPEVTKPEHEQSYEEEVESSVKKEIPSTEDRVIVDVQPIDKLDPILKGKGFNSKIRFGLAHFVFAPYDLEDLTGDEVLVLKTLQTSDVPVINSVKGAVVEALLSDEALAAIRVPLVHGMKNAFEILHDKEVITIDPQSGQVYLGAGVKDVSELKVDKRGIVDSEAEKAMERMSSKLPVIKYDDPDNVPIKTTCDFWQYLDMKDLAVETKNSQGYYLATAELMQALGYDPGDMLGNKQRTDSFISEATAFIMQVFSISPARHMILETASSRYKKDHNIGERGLELLNVDLALITRLRNKENIRNIWLALGDIKNEDDLIEAKKEITAGGMRRSSSFKLMAVVNSGYSGLSVKSLVENSNVDGIVVDVDNLMESFDVGKSKFDSNMANFIRYILESVNSNNAVSLLLNRSIEVSNDQVKLFLEHGLTQFITLAPKMVDQKLQVSDMELLRITKQKKRGRKRKKIDFGF